MPSATRDIHIKIDVREGALIELLAKQQPALTCYETSSLDIGDVQFWEGGDPSGETLVLALERKTCADMLASVKDGRYCEQKGRAMDNLGPLKYAYVIECEHRFTFTDDTTSSCCGYAGTHAKILRSCVMNSMLRDHIRVFFTSSCQETVHLVLDVRQRLQCIPSTRDCGVHRYNSDVYKSTLKVRRQDNIVTGRTIAELQLAQLPGVSVSTASDILDRLKVSTFADCVRAMDALPDRRTKLKALQEIKLIGKKKAEKILDILFSSSTPLFEAPQIADVADVADVSG